MAIKNTYSAESWEKVYSAFTNINFAAYDYDTVKQSLIDYLKLYHKENFNDFIESSELIAILEIFAYSAEQLAYRMDMLSHENFITTAQRKQSILKLAKLISYKAARNYPASGLVKLTSVTANEDIFDSIGTNLNGRVVLWNDPNNSNWKEQFLLVMNHVMVGQFGQPNKSIQVGDVAMHLYTLNNEASSFFNGVYNFTAESGNESFPMELVSADLDGNGVFERTPDMFSQMNIIYASDGLGDGSDYTGFLMLIKQGSLLKQELNFTASIPNRTISLTPLNINQIDVWVNKVDSAGVTLEKWENVGSLPDQNITYNTNKSRTKFEVETLENDKIKLIFGDGDFADIPLGKFHVWIRQSINRTIIIQKNKIVNESFSFGYRTTEGLATTCSVSFSLINTIQNSTPSETIEHIRQAAPASYYAQNRMVNGQDYNTFLLKDPSIIRLKTINRTFAGQPKYIEWNDPSGQYENVKVFGDDLRISSAFFANKLSANQSGRAVIDTVIEPLLLRPAITNLLRYVTATATFNSIPEYLADAVIPTRTKFIENTRIIQWKREDDTHLYTSGNGLISSPTNFLKEKTLIQGALDSHWYGEPIEYVLINNRTYAKINDPVTSVTSDENIWTPDIPRTVDGINEYIPGDIGSLHQQVSYFQSFGLKYIPMSKFIGNGTFGYVDSGLTVTSSAFKINSALTSEEIWTIVVNSDRSSVTAISNKRGQLPSLPITLNGESKILMSDVFATTPVDFYVEHGTVGFEAGDTFVLKIDPTLLGSSTIYQFNSNEVSSNFIRKVNTLGYWDIIEGGPNVDINGDPLESTLAFKNDLDVLNASAEDSASWIFWITSQRNSETDDIYGFNISYRELKVIVESATTKFWYNETDPAIDGDTGKPVRDIIRILRSNFSKDYVQTYPFELDVLGMVTNSVGEPNFHMLETMPTQKYNSTTNPSAVIPATQLMIDLFIDSSDYRNYRYWIISSDDVDRDEQYIPNTSDFVNINNLPNDILSQFAGWPVGYSIWEIEGVVYGRMKTYAPLDFLWQHFSPYTHMIDPSITNIHDAYILTRGYYENIVQYLDNQIAEVPAPPSALDLRMQYASMLRHKMISDTLVIHPGKIKLLFGSKAASELQAKIRIVPSPSATLSVESIKQEVLTVINKFFAIENWDFGDSFYATELISAIHQRLASEILSVVLVPMYSVNSFGSLFTIKCGLTEILQSAATLDDIEIVEDLTPITLRQS